VIVGTTHKNVDESAANTTMSMVTMNDQIDVQLDPDITPPHPYQLFNAFWLWSEEPCHDVIYMFF